MSIKKRVQKLENIINDTFSDLIVYNDVYSLNGKSYTKEEFEKQYPSFNDDKLKVIEWV